MSASEHAAALSQWIVILIVEILPSQLTISLAGAALICQKQIFRNRVGLVPRPTLVFVWPPIFPLLHGMFRKMWQCGVGGAFENRGRIAANGFFVLTQTIRVLSRSGTTPMLWVRTGEVSACLTPGRWDPHAN